VARAAYLCFYGSCAALGAAAAGRPAVSWMRRLARHGWTAASTVSLGCAFALLGLAIVAAALWLALNLAAKRRPALVTHAALLVLAAGAAALRTLAEAASTP
jgi:hypothetical protein